jgi:hypothetical protein
VGERLRWLLDPAVIPFIAIAFAWAVWAFGAAVEYDTHVKFEGKIKRGIRIWSEPLPVDIERFLRNLSRSILSTRTGRFIRKQDNAVLVQASRVRSWLRIWRWPCVAYIDLGNEEPRIEYRSPISITLFFAMLTGIAIWVNFRTIAALIAVLIGPSMVVVPMLFQRRQILDFVDRTMKANSRQSRAENKAS